MVKGLIFDFDGLILDTETPNFIAWRNLYQSCGVDLSMDIWSDCIGRSADAFDPLEHLQSLLPEKKDRQILYNQYLGYYVEITQNQAPLQGVREILTEGEMMGLKISIASSSPSDWVMRNLEKLRLLDHFPVIVTIEDVHHAKPEPDLFLTAAQKSGIRSDEAIVFEDSPNGIRAAKLAGMKCVAVPNPITARLDLSHADLIIEHLNTIPLTEIIGKLFSKA